MGKFNLHRGSLQLRVLTLTLLFTLGVSIVITVSNMHQLNAEWERTTLLNAEYALQTAAAAIYRDLDEVDDLASWCAYNPSMRTYLLTDSAGNNQALSMYPMISAKYNSMRTLPYIQRFMLINAAGRPMMFGTAATNVVALTPELLQTIPGYNEASYGWAYITRDPLALTTQAAQTIPICRALTLPGTDRTAHVCIFVSPSVITAPLRGFTLSEGGKLLWEMGEHIYTVQNNTLTELDTDRTYYKDTRPFDAETLDSLTEVYERGSGDFSADPAIEWDNELGDIGRGINKMSGNITALMDRRLEDEKQKQDLEYRMLQNQINPHFIYNTLNSIKWMATIQHAPGIAEMVTALSRLLKSVSKGNERLVPLYEEFALLNDYFTIQQYRYGGTITLDVSYIENENLTHSCLIPRFTLQPLVENAIFHGIEPKGSAGEVTLRVERDAANGDVLILLSDDGVGMTPAQAAKALQEPGPEEAAAKYRHVGIWNVHRRLQYSFGDAYGLRIESEPGVGTTVTVRLPDAKKASPAGEAVRKAD